MQAGAHASLCARHGGGRRAQQVTTATELGDLPRRSGPSGWWIITEVGVAYERHQCPSHDLAGWRQERMPERPRGVVELPPDWVCEIVSPGHERKDTLTLFLLLQRHRVPHYWLIWPEDRTLIVHQLDGHSYRVAMTVTLDGDEDGAVADKRMRVPPFDDVELDLGYILGG